MCLGTDETMKTSVVDSPYASNSFPTFNLTTGYLYPEPAANVTQILPWAVSANPGDVFSFVQAIGSPYPAQIFCARVRTFSFKRAGQSDGVLS